MIKFVYVVSLSVMSFLLFIFSKDKDSVVCKNQASGKIELITDASGSHLAIITEDHKILQPSSMNEDIVLAAGQKVTIGYNIDSSALTGSTGTIPVHIQAISYMP